MSQSFDLNRRLGDITRAVQPIQGWCQDAAGANLYLRVLSAPNGNVVELGSWRGRSTIWLACGVEDRGNGHVWAVDTWEGSETEEIHHAAVAAVGGPDLFFNEFLATMKNYQQDRNVTPLRMSTQDAGHWWGLDTRPQVGVLFIDADHRYENVLADYNAWKPFLADGAYVVFDDVPSWDGPTGVVRDVASKELQFVDEAYNQWTGIFHA